MTTETKQEYAWAKTTLSDICSKITDGTHHSPVNKTEGSFMYVTAKNIRRWGLDLTDITYVSEDVHNEIYSRCPVEQGDVLYIKDGVTTGIAAINTCSEPFSMLSSVALLKPIKEAIDSRFLKHWLNSPETLKSMTGNMTGSAIKRLVLKTIRKAEIELPPLNEQHRIADKLDTTLAAVEACKQKLNNAAETIQRFRQSVLAAAVSGELTREWREERGIEGEWPKVSLSDHITKPAYGTSSKSSPSGSVPVLRMGNIQNMELDWGDLVYTSDTEEIEKYKLEKGDVLFNRTNSPELVGKTAIYNGERQAIYAGYLIRVRCNNTLLPEYLNLCLNSPQGRHYCWRVKSDGVSQSNINSKKLSSFKFGLPSIEEQQQLCQQATHLLSEGKEIQLKIENSLQVLNNFAKALLAKAFRGELVPQDPNDEPASVLLERIKAQREAEAAAKKPAKRGRKKKADAAQLVIPKGIADNHLAKVLEECGALSELALLAASELEPAVFQLQLTKELAAGGLKQVDVDGEAFYAEAAWEE